MQRNLLFRTLLFVSLCAAGATLTQAQRTGISASAAPQYRLQATYRAGIAQNYSVAETTHTVRTQSDGSKKMYDRLVTYMMTVRCVESLNNISTLVINIDSLQYSFMADGAKLTYDSQKDITPKDFADLNNYMGPMNRTFEITVGPYGEITKLAGEQVDYWRDYIKENASSMDSTIVMIWLQSLAPENLMQYGDLQKRVIPGLRVYLDSAWTHQFAVRTDGVVYSGPAKTKLTDYSAGFFTIATKDTLLASTQPIHVYGVPYISRLTDGKAVVDHTVTLTSQGTINAISSKVDAWFRATAATEVYTQAVTSSTEWKLVGQYQW
ncbi:MAG: hypothetical protein SGJ05_00140 [bacterium]|nr:hypothetical protein [bacterium]